MQPDYLGRSRPEPLCELLRMRFRSLMACFLLCAAAVSCASGKLDPQWATREHGVVEASAFKTSSELVGFDMPSQGARLAKGDRVLLGMNLLRDGVTTSRTFSVEVLSVDDVRWPGSSDDEPLYVSVASVRLRVFDDRGLVLGEEQLSVEAHALECGVARACRGSSDLDRNSARWALRVLFDIIRRSPILPGVMYQVVDPPSLLSIITHLGVKLRSEVHFDKARPTDPFAINELQVPAWSLPHEVMVNGKPALRSVLQVVDSASPLALCAGIVSFTSVHPTDPSRILKVRLLAARRGQP